MPDVAPQSTGTSEKRLAVVCEQSSNSSEIHSAAALLHEPAQSERVQIRATARLPSCLRQGEDQALSFS